MRQKSIRVIGLAMVSMLFVTGCVSKEVTVAEHSESKVVPADVIETPVPEAISDLVADEVDETVEEAAGNFYIENGYLSVELNRETSDVTGDGVLDDVITTMYILPEEWEKDTSTEEKINENIWVCNACVTIHDGATKTEDDYGNVIWTRDYAAPHCGNGQLSLIRAEDGDYLLASDLYIGMGEAGYHYEVFSLSSNGEKQIKDEGYFSMMIEGDTEASCEEQEETIHTFAEKIMPWVKQGEIIIATDVDLEKQFVTYEDVTYSSAEYYDIALYKYMPE